LTALLPANSEWLWTLQIILQLIAVFCSVRAKLYLEFPAAFSYVAFCGARSLVLRLIASVATSNALYFVAFWSGSVCEYIFLIFVVRELARPLFAPWSIIPIDPKRWFHCCVGLLIGISAILPLWSNHSFRSFSYYRYLLALARTLIRSTSLIFVGVMLLGCALAWYHSIPWDRKARALTIGLVVKYVVEAAFWFAILVANRAFVAGLQWIRISAAIAASMFFIVAGLIPEKQTLDLSEEHVARLRKLGDWFCANRFAMPFRERTKVNAAGEN
jgi:hypothetical protein